MKKKRIVLWVLLLLWMGMIFSFSSEVAEVSDGKSNFIVGIIEHTGLKIENIGDWNHIVRKCAHFTEYAILGILAYLALNQELKCRGNEVGDHMILKFIVPSIIIFTFLYACSDELHQLFIKGRSGQIKDVLLDTAGGTFGSFLIFFVKKVKKVVKNYFFRKNFK